MGGLLDQCEVTMRKADGNQKLTYPVTFKPQLRGCGLSKIMHLTTGTVRAGSDYTTCVPVQWGDTGQDEKERPGCDDVYCN